MADFKSTVRRDVLFIDHWMPSVGIIVNCEIDEDLNYVLHTPTEIDMRRIMSANIVAVKQDNKRWKIYKCRYGDVNKLPEFTSFDALHLMINALMTEHNLPIVQMMQREVQRPKYQILETYISRKDEEL